MKYKIESFDEKVGQIVVEFEDGIRTAVDLPVDTSNRYPEGIELKTLITSHYPTWYVDRIKQISNGVTNADYIKNSIEIKEELVVEESLPQEETVITLEESEQLQIDAFKEIIISVLKERGILSD